MMDKRDGGLRALMDRLGYALKDESLLVTALTHPSYGGDHHVPHYQRLEFLGDAVLELTISRILYAEFPNLPEGQLTRIRAELVREETLSEIARGLELGAQIRLSVGEEKSGGRDRASILCDVCEAVIAAVYLDGGFDEAFALIKRLWDDRLKEDLLDSQLDAKTKLQELLQRARGVSPEYELLSSEGPAHKPVFAVCVKADGEELGRGEGASKRLAQQMAAREALKKLGNC